jgi:hypothetical protein
MILESHTCGSCQNSECRDFRLIKHQSLATLDRASNEIVFDKMPCQPCAGYICKEFGVPECIKRVSVENVTKAIEKIL